MPLQNYSVLIYDVEFSSRVHEDEEKTTRFFQSRKTLNVNYPVRNNTHVSQEELLGFFQ